MDRALGLFFAFCLPKEQQGTARSGAKKGGPKKKETRGTVSILRGTNLGELWRVLARLGDVNRGSARPGEHAAELG